jgi:hypothetical protein
MKSLPFQRITGKNNVMVDCSGKPVSVYSACAYCSHCVGIRVGNRVIQSPQVGALNDLRRRGAADEVLMNAAMMFNTLVRDGAAVECSDDKNEGYSKLF